MVSLIPPEIKWLKNEQEFVPDGSRVKAFLNDDGTFGLIFDTTTGDDKGTYTAVAVNSDGQARSNAHVAIKTRMKEGVEKSAPSFSRPLGDVSVDEGQKLRITTPVKGNPVPTFTWTKEGKPIDPKRVHFFSDGELVSSFERQNEEELNELTFRLLKVRLYVELSSWKSLAPLCELEIANYESLASSICRKYVHIHAP